MRIFYDNCLTDPYSEEDKELFSKCDTYCPGEEHQQSTSSAVSSSINNASSSTIVNSLKSYCELPIFHSEDPKKSKLLSNGEGYVDCDGHHFKCRDPTSADFHIIFVIDRSGSMSASDQVPIPNTFIHRILKDQHNNRLGAVYDAIYSFMEARQSSLDKRKCNDTSSVVLFDNSATTVYQNQPLDSFNNLLEMMKYECRGWTDFAVAIKQASEVCLRNYQKQRYAYYRSLLFKLNFVRPSNTKLMFFILFQEFLSLYFCQMAEIDAPRRSSGNCSIRRQPMGEVQYIRKLSRR